VKYVTDCTGVDDDWTAASPPDPAWPFSVPHPTIKWPAETPHPSCFLHDDLFVVMRLDQVPDQVVIVHPTPSNTLHIVIERALSYMLGPFRQGDHFRSAIELTRHAKILKHMLNYVVSCISCTERYPANWTVRGLLTA
jgi:hypothetical protein